MEMGNIRVLVKGWDKGEKRGRGAKGKRVCNSGDADLDARGAGREGMEEHKPVETDGVGGKTEGAETERLKSIN